jgi:hypothetical protein
MKLGPGGAFGFEKGLVFSQASKATLKFVAEPAHVLRSQSILARVPGLDTAAAGCPTWTVGRVVLPMS